MIILLKEFLSKNKADTFISFIKNQMISLYNELTTCENINNSLFLQIVNKNDIFVKVNNNDVIQGTITVLLETKIIHNGMSVAHLEDFVVKKKFRTFIGSIFLKLNLSPLFLENFLFLISQF